jgi:hypothetical protein
MKKETSKIKLIPVSAGSFHFEEGELFGVILKVVWNKIYPALKDWGNLTYFFYI